MKKISTVGAMEMGKIAGQRLTIGLDRYGYNLRRFHRSCNQPR
jgi:hypothetical protein